MPRDPEDQRQHFTPFRGREFQELRAYSPDSDQENLDPLNNTPVMSRPQCQRCIWMNQVTVLKECAVSCDK
ncbi:unnamed protein product [Dicrocoelium dendriticum]|nr:unnamed protein product [Dicrocoelium dendriticum]